MAATGEPRFVACAFKPDFPLAKLSGEWQASLVLGEAKESRMKHAVGGGRVFLYAYGVLVFHDVDPREREAEIAALARILGISLAEQVATEEFLVVEAPAEKPHVEESRLVIDRLTPSRAAVIAQLLAQSAAMEYYEELTGLWKQKVLEQVSGVADKGRISMSQWRLNRLVGEALVVRTEVVGVLHLLDKPDMIWDDPEMDRLYEDLRAAFDLGDRFRSLEYKLQLTQESLSVLISTKRDTRLYLAEWLIILLIVLEVAFSLFQRFHLLGW